LVSSYETGRLLSGFRLAIIGRPNVGKSSLLNALLQEDRAIVTSLPGTTRDVVSGILTFGGVPAECLDTAGIRAVREDADTAEAEGIRRSWREVERAHLVLCVLDSSVPLTDEDVALVREARKRTKSTGAAIILIFNKMDLQSAWEPPVAATLLDAVGSPSIRASAKTGENIDRLREKVRDLLGLEFNPEDILLTDSRHLSLLEEADGILRHVGDGLREGVPQDVAATELWGADRALGRILGEELGAADLDEIFSRFCIGK
jgi:tRNA modification GTPase